MTKLRTADLILVAVFLALAAGIWLFAPASGGDTVIISIDGKRYGAYPLGEDRMVEVRHEDRINVVVISGGAVYMADANCPDQLCLRQGAARLGAIVCLPNRVVVERSASDGPDEVAF